MDETLSLSSGISLSTEIPMCFSISRASLRDGRTRPLRTAFRCCGVTSIFLAKSFCVLMWTVYILFLYM